MIRPEITYSQVQLFSKMQKYLNVHQLCLRSRFFIVIHLSIWTLFSKQLNEDSFLN